MMIIKQEPHLLHTFEEDFYGEKLHLVLCGFIRNELNFNSLGEMYDDELKGELNDPLRQTEGFKVFNTTAVITIGSLGISRE